MITHTQRGVIRGAAAGFVVSVLALVSAIALAPPALLPAVGADLSVATALGHALGWSTLPLACLALSVGSLARHRFFSPEDIDGGGLSSGTPRARILQSILQNTLEQSVLAVVTYLAWAAVQPIQWQAAIPTAAMLFVIGRVAFRVGYAKGAPARSLGFALTFYPTVLMLFAVLVTLGGRILS